MRRANDPGIRQFCFVAIALLTAWALAPVSAQEAQVSAPRMPVSGSPVPVTERLVPVSALQLPADTPQVPLSARQLDAADFDHVDLDYLNQPLVEDWSTSHVVFSNPGTLEEAQRNGKEEHWRRIVSDPRYRMQWVKRYGAALRTPAVTALLHPAGAEEQDRAAGEFRKRVRGDERFGRDMILTDWSQTIATSPNSGNSAGVAPGQYPAKFGFFPFETPNCTSDYVVYPVSNNATGNANLVGFNNLYNQPCTSDPTIPIVLFAYSVGTGSVTSSPVLSLDGTKVAFMESLSSGSYFHVLTLDKSGNSGCSPPPFTTPCNGTAYNAAVSPCTQYTVSTSGTVTGTPDNLCAYNAAVDTRIALETESNGGGTITRSSPFVDYTNDIAYVGDDFGYIHKFTGIFHGSATVTPPTLTEVVISGYWPACTGTFDFLLDNECTSAPILSSPVVDGCATNSGSTPAPTCPGAVFGSGLVLIGGSNGTLYAAPTPFGGSSYDFTSSTNSPSVSTTTILDAPILDGTTEKVIVASNTGTGSSTSPSSQMVLTQLSLPTSCCSPPTVGNVAAMGPKGIDAYRGAFDNNYLTSSAHTGYMYFCGGSSTSTPPGAATLYRVVITSGTMAANFDPTITPLQMGPNNVTAGPNYDCSPLTEFFNSNVGTSGTDFLFVGLRNGASIGPCNTQTCLLSFILPAATGVPFPTGNSAMASFTTSGTPANNGVSGIIIDNNGTVAGESNVYLGNFSDGTGKQLAQSGLSPRGTAVPKPQK
jgi:hypothetical protein